MNKPVAWAYDWQIKTNDWEGDYLLTVTPEKKEDYQIPLYTHPAELTDEEIDKAIEYANMQGYGSSYVEGLSDGFEMAKAILRKAQEK